MPYIQQEQRTAFKEGLLSLDPREPGELNYCITKIVHDFLTMRAKIRAGKDAKPNYAEYNAAIGALECAKLELYRRMIAPYEDIKIWENGDV